MCWVGNATDFFFVLYVLGRLLGWERHTLLLLLVLSRVLGGESLCLSCGSITSGLFTERKATRLLISWAFDRAGLLTELGFRAGLFTSSKAQFFGWGSLQSWAFECVGANVALWFDQLASSP